MIFYFTGMLLLRHRENCLCKYYTWHTYTKALYWKKIIRIASSKCVWIMDTKMCWYIYVCYTSYQSRTQSRIELRAEYMQREHQLTYFQRRVQRPGGRRDGNVHLYLYTNSLIYVFMLVYAATYVHRYSTYSQCD